MLINIIISKSVTYFALAHFSHTFDKENSPKKKFFFLSDLQKCGNICVRAGWYLEHRL